MSIFTFGAVQETKTVDGVLSAFRNTITDLQSVAAQQSALATEHAAKVVEAQQAQTVAETEALRATNIAAQMQAVFN